MGRRSAMGCSNGSVTVTVDSPGHLGSESRNDIEADSDVGGGDSEVEAVSESATSSYSSAMSSSTEYDSAHLVLVPPPSI